MESPPTPGIHNVNHVSQLKLCPNPTAISNVPITVTVTASSLEPESILERKMVKRGKKAVTNVLVKWQNLLPDQATWEYYYDLSEKFPNFHP